MDLNVMISVEEALDNLRRTIRPLADRERLPSSAALDRVLALDTTAPFSVPPADNSAMDGFALRCRDLKTRTALSLAGTALAGAPWTSPLADGQCIRIMTGALVPPDCDAVIMQEECETRNHGGSVQVRIKRMPRPGENIRRAGEDIAAGESLLPAGRRLRPADLGLLASVGLSSVEVMRRPRVALLSTGTELREPGTELPPGAIYDSNRYVIAGMLQRLGAQVTDLGICADTPQHLERVLSEATRAHDVIIASGGVSVGSADHTRQVLGKIGRIEAWKVAMKPGKPFTFGYIDDTLFIGLPGNPVSATVTFNQLALPALRYLAGETSDDSPLMLEAVAATPLKKKPGRADFQRAVLQRGSDGALTVRTTGAQGSGVLTSISHANAFIRLEAERGAVTAGETVSVLPFDRWLM
jgi:molybdopterin molybdotransferase